MATLEEVRSEALSCTRCRLSQTRTQVVWMDGNPDSDLLFIGEGPGFHEDKQGLPFVGAAGKLLNSMLAEIGLDRTSCAIVNVVKCRPPGNRNPMEDEIESCSPYLRAQIDAIHPKVIVTLGNFASKYVLQSNLSISKLRGQRFEAFGATVIPTFHPAAVLHGGGEKSPAMAAIRNDFRLVSQVLEEHRESSIIEGDLIEQPSLF